MSFFSSPYAVGRPDAAARKQQAATGEAGAARLRVMTVLNGIFNVMALNGVLVIACLPIITAPAALQAAMVALERWRTEGEDRAVREFVLALRFGRFWHTTLSAGVPLLAAALAVEEVQFFARAGTAENAVGLGLGVAGLILALASSGYVLVLGVRKPDLTLTDQWFLAVALTARNVLGASPLLAVEFIAAALLLARDPSLAVIGIPVGLLVLAGATARRGIRRAPELFDADAESPDDREVAAQ